MGVELAVGSDKQYSSGKIMTIKMHIKHCKVCYLSYKYSA